MLLNIKKGQYQYLGRGSILSKLLHIKTPLKFRLYIRIKLGITVLNSKLTSIPNNLVSISGKYHCVHYFYNYLNLVKGRVIISTIIPTLPQPFLLVFTFLFVFNFGKLKPPNKLPGFNSQRFYSNKISLGLS